MSDNNRNNVDGDFGFIGGYNPFDDDFNNRGYSSNDYNYNSNNNDPYSSAIINEDADHINSYGKDSSPDTKTAEHTHNKRAWSKNPIDKPIIGIILFFAFCMFLGAFITLISTSPRSNSYNSFMSNAVEVFAKCSNVQVNHGDYNYEHYADISYTYNGKTYTGKHVLIDHEVSDGESIRLFIDPKNPNNVIQDKNQEAAFRIEFAVGYTLLAIGAVLIIIAIAAIIHNIKIKRLYNISGEYSFVRVHSNQRNIKNYDEYDRNYTKQNTAYNSYSGIIKASSPQKDMPSGKTIRKMVIIIVIIGMILVSFLNGIHIFPAIFTKLDNDKFMETAVAVEGECANVRVTKYHRDHLTKYTYYARISYNYNGQYTTSPKN